MRLMSSRSSTRRDHLADLPLQHVGRRAESVAVVAAQPQRSRGVADRRERVAQLVRQHRQELVLAAVGFGQIRRQAAQVVFQPPRSVTSWLTVASAIGLSGGVGQRQHLVGHPAGFAGLEVPEADLDLAVARSPGRTGRTRP